MLQETAWPEPIRGIWRGRHRSVVEPLYPCFSFYPFLFLPFYYTFGSSVFSALTSFFYNIFPSFSAAPRLALFSLRSYFKFPLIFLSFLLHYYFCLNNCMTKSNLFLCLACWKLSFTFCCLWYLCFWQTVVKLVIFSFCLVKNLCLVLKIIRVLHAWPWATRNTFTMTL